MSKRKSPSKKTGSRKMAAIATQAIPRSPKHSPAVSARHSSVLTPFKGELSTVEVPETRFQDSQKHLGNETEKSRVCPRNSQLGEGLTAPSPTHPKVLKQQTSVEISEPLQDDDKLSETENGSDMPDYQANLLELLGANIHFSFEYAQRLMTIASPVEVLSINSEFTSRWIAMLLRHSNQMADLVLRRSWLG
ncbi:hypothetical protein Q2941_29800 [Bradyrhizobium sp. UFLA05-153]